MVRATRGVEDHPVHYCSTAVATKTSCTIPGLPDLDIDMVIATPCNNLAVMSTMDEIVGLFAPLHQSIKKDPNRFEFTEEEQMYWAILWHAHSTMNNGGLRGLEELQYVDSDVQDNLEKFAKEKQTDETAATSQQRKNQKEKDDPGRGNIVVMIGNGMGCFKLLQQKLVMMKI
ncbi:hypothetical protein KIN20_021490 [Parelaphostrongylus tenuis]|uniref:Uncharacterized protein n=1 Tax=Parelaphostrongylus tenuis TaxID=148309 RepID=A0AAD5N4K1_PARTN|nr:hypothetical protein KIN20_021490 [Parelaphostrongylus tenuis]